MAIYHLHAQIIGRGSGRSAVAAAAYRSTTKLTDNETGIICDYTRKTKAAESGILAPPDAPKWVHDRSKLWNSVQEKENRKNSQFAYEYDLALPAEVKNYMMINKFCHDNFVSKGLICDYAIHKPDKKGDKRNWHAHVLVTTREMTADGWGNKHRRGENKFSDRRDQLNEIRQSWENICNEHLERIGSKERVDCRTLEAQGVERIPTQHQGYVASSMERRGETPERLRKDTRAEETKAPAVELEQIKTIEAEEKALAEKIRLANLSDTAFRQEYKNLETAVEYKATSSATSEMLPEIEKANAEEFDKLKKQKTEILKKKPSAVAKKPSAVKSFFLQWKADDGKVFDKHEDYAKHQQKIISGYFEKINPVLEREKELSAEKKLIEDAKSKDTAALSLGLKQQGRKNIFEKIKGKAQELLKNAAEFSGYRNFKAALDEVAQARAESSRRERERNQAQERGFRR